MRIPISSQHLLFDPSQTVMEHREGLISAQMALLGVPPALRERMMSALLKDHAGLIGKGSAQLVAEKWAAMRSLLPSGGHLAPMGSDLMLMAPGIFVPKRPLIVLPGQGAGLDIQDLLSIMMDGLEGRLTLDPEALEHALDSMKRCIPAPRAGGLPVPEQILRTLALHLADLDAEEGALKRVSTRDVLDAIASSDAADPLVRRLLQMIALHDRDPLIRALASKRTNDGEKSN